MNIAARVAACPVTCDPSYQGMSREMLLRRASVDLQNMARALAGEVDSLLVAELMMLSSRLETKV